jgi:hypothetical protein
VWKEHCKFQRKSGNFLFLALNLPSSYFRIKISLFLCSAYRKCGKSTLLLRVAFLLGSETCSHQSPWGSFHNGTADTWVSPAEMNCPNTNSELWAKWNCYRLGTVTQACNLSCMRGWDWETYSLRPDGAKNSQDPISTNKCRACCVPVISAMQQA